MKRKNFYMLLDLSIEPPEENQEKIETAIKKKQAEWSRQRNHPTRGIQAKQCIGLIPEIKKVMTDPDLRAKEANSAKKLIAEKNKDKFMEIDRHLSIFFSKGIVTSREIQKLVKIHSVETDEILKWILKREKEKKDQPDSEISKGKPVLTHEEKLEKIHKNLGIKMWKGFVLDEEISSLAKSHNLDQNEVLKSIKYPIRSKNDALPDEKPRSLDQSILKTINNNLKIVGKTTLYEFLELPGASDTKSLKTRAMVIQKELLTISKKDAAVTSGGILAGHCITIFKNDETRTAYDVARAKSILATLNSDIEVAEIDGVIRIEYFESIAMNAAEFGMNYDEACDYIEEYSAKHNWIAKSKRKKKRFIMMTTIAAALILVITIASIVTITMLKTRRLTDEYNQVIGSVKNQKSLEHKKKILTDFINSHDKNEFTPKAQNEVKIIQGLIKKRNIADERHYKTALKEAKEANVNNNYEKTKKIYENYLRKHPLGKHAQEFKTKTSEIPSLIDNRDFQAINNTPETASQIRLELCTSYLTSHPEGNFRQEVIQLIANMDTKYFNFLRKKITTYEKQKNWKECINRCDQYFKYYPNGKHFNQLKGEQYFYAKQLEKRNLLQNLIQKAEKNHNVKNTIKIYADYLKANPNSPIKYEVKKRMTKYQNKKK